DMAHIWKAVSEVLYDVKVGKIGQNFKYDELQLDTPVNRTVQFGMPLRGYYFDTNLGMRTLYPELPSRLEFIASVLTREPYYKDEGKEYNPKKDRPERLLNYCGKDSVVTFEAYEEQ